MGKSKTKESSKKNYKAYLDKKSRKSRVKNKQPNTNNEKAEVSTKPEFLEAIKVTPDMRLQEQPIAEEKHEESEFVRKVKGLTKGYTRALEDIMIMYSEAKGTDKMSLDEFTKYENLQRNFAKELKKSANNSKRAYAETLAGYPKGSDEAIILQGLIDEISKTQER